MVKPFLEPKTYKKVKFVYMDQPNTMNVMEALFEMDKLESAFGGKNTESFEFEAYAKRMRDEETQKCLRTGNATELLQDSDLLTPDVGSEDIDSSSHCNDRLDATEVK